jgi:uncharacterized protein YkvS
MILIELSLSRGRGDVEKIKHNNAIIDIIIMKFIYDPV